MLQVVDNAVFWKTIHSVRVFRRFLLWSRDIPNMGLVRNIKGNVNQTNTVNFDAHWTSGAKKGGFEISLATDL